MELFIIHLQFPRDCEKIMLKVWVLSRILKLVSSNCPNFLCRQAQDVHTERLHISNAEIIMLQNTVTQRLRLVVQSRNGYAILSQECMLDYQSLGCFSELISL